MNPNLSSDSVFVVQSLSRVQLFGIPWSAAHQALLSMEFSRQEYWSGLPCPPPGDLPDEPMSLDVSCTGRRVLYHWCHLGSPKEDVASSNNNRKHGNGKDEDNDGH